MLNFKTPFTTSVPNRFLTPTYGERNQLVSNTGYEKSGTTNTGPMTYTFDAKGNMLTQGGSRLRLLASARKPIGSVCIWNEDNRLERDVVADLAAAFPGDASFNGSYAMVFSSHDDLYLDDVRFSNSMTVEKNVLGGGGIPLAVSLTGANTNDCTQLLPLVDAVVALRGRRGRPRRRPKALYADRAYHGRSFRRGLRERGIELHLARRGEPNGSGLGKKRWVVERTLSWLHQYRRLRVRYERRADIHEAFMTIGAILICARRLF